MKSNVAEAVAPLTDLQVTIYEPKGAPSTESMAHSREIPKMPAGRAALVELMHRYLCGLLNPMVTLLEIHILMYSMQEAGEPLKVGYQKAIYGPYAENLRHVLHAIEGHLVSGYADGCDAPDRPLKLVPGAVRDAALPSSTLHGNTGLISGRDTAGFDFPRPMDTKTAKSPR